MPRTVPWIVEAPVPGIIAAVAVSPARVPRVVPGRPAHEPNTPPGAIAPDRVEVTTTNVDTDTPGVVIIRVGVKRQVRAAASCHYGLTYAVLDEVVVEVGP